MTKAEIEIELIHAIHYLSFEEMQDMLKNVLTRVKKEPLEPTYHAENDINVWQNLSPELDSEQQEWEW
jgi:hypothetical protein